jgi:hypothetical protein
MSVSDAVVSWPLSCADCEVAWTGTLDEPCWLCGEPGDCPYVIAQPRTP